MPHWLTTATAMVAGAGLIAFALRDVFGALFHPGGRTAISRGIPAGTWALLHRSGPRGRGAVALAGPLSLALVIVAWAAMLILGFALVYLPHVPDGFILTADLRKEPAALTALYFSIVSLATLGYGDMTPDADWLQIVAPLEAMVGFGLLTAAISWLLSIHPVLSRRRALAYEIALMERTESPAEALEQQLEQLHGRLTAVERDLVAYPITFYFAELDRRFSLAATLPALARVADEVERRDLPARSRLHAAMLREAIADFAATARRFPGYRTLSPEDALARYAAQQAPASGP